MKKYLLLFFITILLFNCAKIGVIQIPKKKSILEIEDDSKFLNKAIPIIKKNKLSERELIEIAERSMTITISTDDKNYEIAKKYLLQYQNKFFAALSLNSIIWENRENENLFQKTNELIEQANKFTYTEAFADSGLSYFSGRGYSSDEKSEALSSYKGMIRDTYALYLKKRGKIEEAIKTYETIIDEYQETGILLNYASLLNKMNRYQQALESTISALRMTTGSENAKDSLRVYAKNLAYSDAEIKSIIEETVQGGRSKLKAELLSKKLDEPMPFFKIESINGNFVSSEEFAGKILIVDFWATWCGPCRREFPHLNELVNEYSTDNEVQIIAISTDKEKEKVIPFIEKNKYTIPVFYDNDTADSFGVRGIPSLFIIDKNGIIRYKKVGFTEGEEFSKIMGWYIGSLSSSK
ncbi:MAG: redoxin domain-containing protein [Candidatus Marinimicrobia bacterium]|jgi:thiol-disulfide isomerase/thioredoxin|nr:redoxin domain-containing protein [Candidatus Neomarinimicrobiota bacterium]